MPLPKPPAKPAALLSPEDFESQAAPRPARRPHKPSSPAAEPAMPGVLDLLDTRAAPSIVSAPTGAPPRGLWPDAVS